MEAIMDKLLQLDLSVLIFIQEYIRYDAANPLFIWLYRLGAGGALWIAISIILLIPKRTRRTGALSLVSILCAWFLSGYLLPGYVDRPRPYEALSYVTYIVEDTGTSSFPSICACISFASAALIFKNRPRRLGVPCMLLAVVVSFSALYVGVSYPSDVICGAVIGLLIGLIMYWLLGDSWKKKKKRRR